MDDLQKAHPISIHSARVGGDLSVQSARSTQPNFNPLRPCGRRPLDAKAANNTNGISIHSARVGGDS